MTRWEMRSRRPHLMMVRACALPPRWSRGQGAGVRRVVQCQMACWSRIRDSESRGSARSPTHSRRARGGFRRSARGSAVRLQVASNCRSMPATGITPGVAARRGDAPWQDTEHIKPYKGWRRLQIGMSGIRPPPCLQARLPEAAGLVQPRRRRRHCDREFWDNPDASTAFRKAIRRRRRRPIYMIGPWAPAQRHLLHHSARQVHANVIVHDPSP